MTQLIGKYVGLVVSNDDPLGRGRLKVRVPRALGEAEPWAAACLSAAEARDAANFVPPPVGAEVWIEFEEGDAARPVWTGCLWPAHRSQQR